MTPIGTRRLILRSWEERDRETFRRLNSDEQVMEFFPFRRNQAESDALMDWLQAEIDEHGFGFAAAEEERSGRCIGFVGIRRETGIPAFTPAAVEIGWRLAPEFWGQGYASEAATAWLEFGFARLGLVEIVSFAVWNNRRSIAVMERIGMLRDPRRDFDHPRVPEDMPHLKRHAVYALSRERWAARKRLT